MSTFRKPFETGFTLLELLVVISIIGLLSSVVLASVSGARGKAMTTKEYTDINAYKTALALYYADHNHYPGDYNSFYCLGNYPTRSCFVGIVPGTQNDALNTELSPYIPSLPSHTNPIMVIGGKGSTLSEYGYIYSCSDPNSASANCQQAVLAWIVDQKNATCNGGVAFYQNSGNVYECVLVLD